MNDIGKKIKSFRKHKNISQEEFAKSIGISRQSLSGYENGKNEPPFFVISKISEVYTINIDDLYNEKFEFDRKTKIFLKIKDISLIFVILFFFNSLFMVSFAVFLSNYI